MTARIPWLRVVPVVLLVLLGAHWVWSERSDRLEQAAAVEAEADALEAQLSAARAATEHQDELQRELALATAAVPDSADLPGLIATLNSLATASSLEWRNARFGTPVAPARAPTTDASPTTAAAGAAPATAATTAAPALGTVTIEIEVGATDATLRTYLDALARLPRLLVVDKVVVSWGGVNAPYTLRANLTVRAFTLATASTPGTTRPGG